MTSSSNLGEPGQTKNFSTLSCGHSTTRTLLMRWLSDYLNSIQMTLHKARRMGPAMTSNTLQCTNGWPRLMGTLMSMPFADSSQGNLAQGKTYGDTVSGHKVSFVASVSDEGDWLDYRRHYIDGFGSVRISPCHARLGIQVTC